MRARAGPAAFVGRSEELRTALELLDQAAAGAGRTALIEGEAGIGKTRLVGEVLAAASSLGFAVLQGECDVAVSASPFAAIVRALTSSKEVADADLADVLSVRELESAMTPGAQFRIIERLGESVERIAARGPLLIVLEDLHWADPSTLVTIRSIARRVERSALLIIGTFRPGHGSTELHRVTDEILRSGGVRITIGPLDPTSIASLVEDVIGASPTSELLERIKGAAGNPLFVTEYLRALASEDLVEIDGGVASLQSDVIPVEFRQTVLNRVGHLPEATLNVVRAASVLGSTFSPSDLAAVLRKAPIEVAADLQRAVDAGVLSDGRDQVAFAHALVRDAVYESIPSALRKQLHRDFAQALDSSGADPLIVAHHLTVGAEGRDPEAAEWLRSAARSVAPRSPGVAVELLERALELAGPAAPNRDAFTADLVMPLLWSGRLAEAEEVARRVLAQNSEQANTGTLRSGLSYAATWQGRPREALEYATPSEHEHLSEWDATLLRAHASLARMFAFDLGGAAKDAEDAVAKAGPLGHDLALCTALGVQTFLGALTGDTWRAVETGTKAVAAADRSQHGQGHLANPRFFLAMPLLAVDRPDQAEEALQTGLRIAEDLGHVWSLPLYHAYLGTRRFISGDWDDAIAEFEASLDLAEEIGLRFIAVLAVSSWLTAIRVHRDELELAQETLGRAHRAIAEHGPQAGMSLVAWAGALLQEARGDLDSAISLLRGAWNMSVGMGLHAEPWSGAELVRLYARAGRSEEAADLVPIMQEQAEKIGTPFMRARAIACRGFVQKDPDLLVHAVDLYRQSPRPHELALACEDAGKALAEAGRVDEAIPLLDEAGTLYEPLGAARDMARVRAALRKHGAGRGSRGPRIRATTGWESLTESERRVVDLVAERLSNPEIAERLFISRHTVESHLKHIYSKLGLSSRIELAKQAKVRAST